MSVLESPKLSSFHRLIPRDYSYTFHIYIYIYRDILIFINKTMLCFKVVEVNIHISFSKPLKPFTKPLKPFKNFENETV